MQVDALIGSYAQSLLSQGKLYLKSSNRIIKFEFNYFFDTSMSGQVTYKNHLSREVVSRLLKEEAEWEIANTGMGNETWLKGLASKASLLVDAEKVFRETHTITEANLKELESGF